MTSQSTRSKRERSVPGTTVGSTALTTSWPSRPSTRASASRIARSSSTASILAMFDLPMFQSELYQRRAQRPSAWRAASGTPAASHAR